MNVTVQREREKFVVTIENGFDVKQITFWDITMEELTEFLKGATRGSTLTTNTHIKSFREFYGV